MTSVSKLIESYKGLFDNSQGTFNKCKISLAVKQGTVPKFLKARPVPFALKQKIEHEIDRLVKNKVLVPTEFSDWATPIVPVLKPNRNVRICGDFKVTLNPHLIVQQYPLPRIEYLFSQLHGGDKFSKIDFCQMRTSKCYLMTNHGSLLQLQRIKVFFPILDSHMA